MYGGRNYFNHINTIKNQAITVYIPENASLLDGCRGPYYLFCSLSFSSLSLFCFLCLTAPALDHWHGSNNVGSNHWFYFLFSSLALMEKAQLSYSTPYSEVCCGKEELVSQHLWIPNILWLVSQHFCLCVVGVENLLKCTVQNKGLVHLHSCGSLS